MEAAQTTTSVSKTGAGVLSKSSGAYNIDPRRVTRRADWNVRFDFGEIEELAKSIRRQRELTGTSGLLNPIRVKRIKPTTERDFDFEIVDGDRRLSAVELILKKDADFFDETGIPAMLVDKAQDDFTSLIQMFEANTGKPLLPLEEAVAFKRLFDYGVAASVKKADIFKWIAKQVGRSDIYVWETMQLLAADEDVQEALKTKAITGTTARQIAIHAKGDSAKQKDLVQKAKAAGKDKTKKAALKKELDDARRAKHAKKGRVLKIRALSDADLTALGKTLAATMLQKLKDAGKPADFNIRDWVKKDDKLALAAAFGALEALKAAAGMKISLDF